MKELEKTNRLKALLYIACAAKPVTRQELADHLNTPATYAATVATDLVNAGYVKSLGGKSGYYIENEVFKKVAAEFALQL